jgi:putative transposase
MGRSRYKIYENQQPYFLTCTVVRWLPLFRDATMVGILLDSLRFLQDEGRLELYAYVIMENHLHLVAASEHLSKEIGDFKSYTARTIIDGLTERKKARLLQQLSHFKAAHKKDRTYQLWQEGNHPELIQGYEMMRQKIEYIHQNPVTSRLVDRAEDWPYSSACNYVGIEGLLKVRTEW